MRAQTVRGSSQKSVLFRWFLTALCGMMPYVDTISTVTADGWLWSRNENMSCFTKTRITFERLNYSGFSFTNRRGIKLRIRWAPERGKCKFGKGDMAFLKWAKISNLCNSKRSRASWRLVCSCERASATLPCCEGANNLIHFEPRYGH